MDRSSARETTRQGPAGDVEDREGGKTAPGESAGSRGQLDGASGGYGSQSGTATSSGSGDGESTEEGSGGGGTPPTDWLRDG